MHHMSIVTMLSALTTVLGGAVPAEAHPFGAHGAGFATGFAHPFAGLDHVLAMLAVGLWAAELGGRARWLVPTAFVVAMTAGGLAGTSHWALPFGELGIAASLVVLGVLVAGKVRAPAAVGAVVVAAFAVFHGHAHGTELAGVAAPVSTAAGFVAATLALHGIGLALGDSARRLPVHGILRFGGATIAAVGLALVFAG